MKVLRSKAITMTMDNKISIRVLIIEIPLSCPLVPVTYAHSFSPLISPFKKIMSSELESNEFVITVIIKPSSDTDSIDIRNSVPGRRSSLFQMTFSYKSSFRTKALLVVFLNEPATIMVPSDWL